MYHAIVRRNVERLFDALRRGDVDYGARRRSKINVERRSQVVSEIIHRRGLPSPAGKARLGARGIDVDGQSGHYNCIAQLRRPMSAYDAKKTGQGDP